MTPSKSPRGNGRCVRAKKSRIKSDSFFRARARAVFKSSQERCTLSASDALFHITYTTNCFKCIIGRARLYHSVDALSRQSSAPSLSTSDKIIIFSHGSAVARARIVQRAFIHAAAIFICDVCVSASRCGAAAVNAMQHAFIYVMRAASRLTTA